MAHISDRLLKMPPKKNVASWCKIRPISTPDAAASTTVKQTSRKPGVKKQKPPPPPEPWVEQDDSMELTVAKTNKKQAPRKPAVKKQKLPPPPEPWVDQDDCMELPGNAADTDFSWMDRGVDDDALVEEEQESASDVFHDGASSCNGSIDGMSDDQVSETSQQTESTESTVTTSKTVRKATVQYDGPDLEFEAEVL